MIDCEAEAEVVEFDGDDKLIDADASADSDGSIGEFENELWLNGAEKDSDF